jgi:hypothetical protein
MHETNIFKPRNAYDFTLEIMHFLMCQFLILTYMPSVCTIATNIWVRGQQNMENR